MTTDAKGPTKIPKMRPVGREIYEDNGCGNNVAVVGLHGRTEATSRVIASFFADAANIYVETKKTLRELVEEMKILRGALQGLIDLSGNIDIPISVIMIARAALSPEKKEADGE